MNNITRVSQITVSDLADYIRLSEVTENDENTLQTYLTVAKNFMASYTGHTIAELDDYSDFVIVALVLVQDMWDNRTLYVDKTNLNKIVDAILGMHSVNLLPQVEGESADES